MQLHALAIENFRNLKHVLLEPHPCFNVVSGDNGQGKTNLLEAIFLLATQRSFRTHRIEEQIGFGERKARVRARIRRGDSGQLLEIELSAGPPVRKIALVDGKTARAGDYFGRVNAVLFVPNDLNLPGGPPAARRRFLDRAIWNTCPTYLVEVQTYERILKSRNALLRDDRKGGAPLYPPHAKEDLLAVYDQQLAMAGAVLVRRRQTYLAALSGEVTAAFQRVSRITTPASLRYKSTVATPDEVAPPDDLAQRLGHLLQRDRRRDVLKGYTHSGPHTDDLLFEFGGRDAAAYASQGQLRAFILALKIAEIRHLQGVLNEPPILLLDDVSSELDATRNAQLFEFLHEIRAQTFITTTSAAHIQISADTADRRDFAVIGGEIDAMEGNMLH